MNREEDTPEAAFAPFWMELISEELTTLTDAQREHLKELKLQPKGGVFLAWMHLVISRYPSLDLAKKQVADLAGVTQPSVSGWFERGSISSINFAWLVDLDALSRPWPDRRDSLVHSCRYVITKIRREVLGDKTERAYLRWDEFAFLAAAHQISCESPPDAFQHISDDLMRIHPTRDSEWFTEVMHSWGKAFRLYHT